MKTQEKASSEEPKLSQLSLLFNDYSCGFDAALTEPFYTSLWAFG